ncbi:helix-turn-helix transcriptional regulator [Aquipseudomonas campi]
MDNTMELEGWRGKLDAGLPRRQLEALIYACSDMTVKQIARRMGIGPASAQQRLDDARFKLGMQRSVRGLCLEALRRGIVAPLAFVMMLGGGYTQQAQPVRRPDSPRQTVQLRIMRRADELSTPLAA